MVPSTLQRSMTTMTHGDKLTPERLRELLFPRLEAAKAASYGMIGLSTLEAEALLDAVEERDRLRARVAELEEQVGKPSTFNAATHAILGNEDPPE